ncbi:hypothetical protein O181_023950 [Austropuccinia psidii MF-1]|uniref:Uncharacterized protein n=1 Tax=Austropuccinia psidii MF-1 TaxID=1389203 RepID=A0A9Q3CJK7_9BASI|nr:hypothetical protein [Austropuccinia psidii MF-1]
MTPTRSGSNYLIQSNGSGQGHSSNNFKGQDCQLRGAAQMKDARTSTSYQRLPSIFDTLIGIPEADITAIPVVRPESFPTVNNRNVPVSIQELVYGSKAAGVGTSSQSLDRHNELTSSSGEVHWPRKDRGSSEGLDTHVLQRKSPTDKSLVEKPKHVVRGPEEEVGPMKGQQPSGSSPSLHKQKGASTGSKEGQSNPKEQSQGQEAKGKAKPNWNKPYPQNYRISKKGKTAMKNLFNMAGTLMEFKNKEVERMKQSFSKK